jgi:hypothetical protein
VFLPHFVAAQRVPEYDADAGHTLGQGQAQSDEMRGLFPFLAGQEDHLQKELFKK